MSEVFDHPCVANADGDNEAADSADVLLVAAGGGDEAGGAEIQCR